MCLKGPGKVCYGRYGRSICFGDSGGPLFVKENGKAKCLLGLSSYVKHLRCSENEKYAVFTSVPYYRRWIRDVASLQFETDEEKNSRL